VLHKNILPLLIFPYLIVPPPKEGVRGWYLILITVPPLTTRGVRGVGSNFVEAGSLTFYK
jgi:hypothetical protein